MIEITQVTLENEMDVIVAQKQMIRVAEYFSLSISTQTTIGTAVAEVSRVIIDKTDTGILVIGMEKHDGKYFLTAVINFYTSIEIKVTETGLLYAKKLVPEFSFVHYENGSAIILKIGIPRSFKITDLMIREAAGLWENVLPTSPYEELKQKNSALNKLALMKDEELRNTKIIDEKKNEFISIASHELKTPLTTVIAFTKLALNAGASKDFDKVMRYLKKIDDQALKLHLLIQQLLDVSKIESGQLTYNMEEVNWGEYLNDTLATIEHIVPHHKLHYSFCKASLRLKIDKLRIEQVLTNIIGNAAKYSEQGSNIFIECTNDETNLKISIRDEGIGMSSDNVTRIFEKYFRQPDVVDKYSGFGMGLYITSGIIKEHRGSIYAESVEGKGSTFYVTLPVKSIN